MSEEPKKTYEELQEENEELNALFDLQWKASRRAIARWQAATGRTRVWPDHADLCVWLLEQLDAAEARIVAIASEVKP